MALSPRGADGRVTQAKIGVCTENNICMGCMRHITLMRTVRVVAVELACKPVNRELVKAKGRHTIRWEGAPK